MQVWNIMLSKLWDNFHLRMNQIHSSENTVPAVRQTSFMSVIRAHAEPFGSPQTLRFSIPALLSSGDVLNALSYN